MSIDSSIPRYRENLYSTDATVNPYPHYEKLRRLGPVVWLARHHVYAVSRYTDCKEVLLDDETFISGDGVSLNPVANRLGLGTTLNSDGHEHATKRSVLAHRLTPKALRKMTTTVEEAAEAVVDRTMTKPDVDGVDDLATALPLSLVPDLVGWPTHGRSRLLRWAGATFDAMGPINRQSARAVKATAEMMTFVHRVVKNRSVLDGSMGHDVLTAADKGLIDKKTCPALMMDYIAPSLDATIGAISSALYLFSQHPAQCQAVRSDPTLIPNAVNEVVRVESPLRAFSRRTARDVETGEVSIPRPEFDDPSTARAVLVQCCCTGQSGRSLYPRTPGSAQACGQLLLDRSAWVIDQSGRSAGARRRARGPRRVGGRRICPSSVDAPRRPKTMTACGMRQPVGKLRALARTEQEHP